MNFDKDLGYDCIVCEVNRMTKLSEKYRNEKDDKKKFKLAICEGKCDICDE